MFLFSFYRWTNYGMDKLPDVHNDGIRGFCKNRERIQMNRRRIVFLLHTPGIFISWFSLTKKEQDD